MTSTIMLPNAELLEQLSVTITHETIVKAPLELTFESLLEQLGPFGDRPDGGSLNMKIEPWPGGRWYRDLGENNGHFWGTVQAIKRPTLLEIVGPLFMSYPVINNLQYRLSEENGVTMIKFHHKAFGAIPDEVKTNMVKGWRHMSESARKRAEANAKR